MTTNNFPTFLVEIGTEELPPKRLRNLAETFATKINSELDINGVSHGEISWFATPRRIAVKVAAMNETQEDSNIENLGPTIAQAFDAKGNPTKAALGWARDCGITISQAEYLVNKKGKWLVYNSIVKGKPVQNLLCGIVSNALEKLAILKIIRWVDNKFIWPLRTVTLLLNDLIIYGNILGINVDRVVLGHRFMGEQEIFLDHANNYPQVLVTRGRVIADYFQRKETIRRDVEFAAKKIGGVADLSDLMLEEVTSLVEWPVVLTARFEEKFLSVPAEVLVCTMKKDQKYFPVYDSVRNLLPYFIFVANIESKNPQKIIAGNEKVVRSRLADAEFFFNTDLKQRLEDRLSGLNSVLFQKNLGTIRDKSERVQALAAWIAGNIGANVQHAARAGLLSKCDLITNMVFEFTETQGVMGMHYALHDNEPEAIALAQKEQYHPRFSGDALPTTLVSCAVAIADKMDTLTGILGIGQYPRGDKDPFALRRIAIGVLRIIVEKKLSLDLQTMTLKTRSFYGDKLNNDSVVNDVIDFMFSRFRTWYQDQGYDLNIIQAVLAISPTCPVDFDARVRAVSYFCNFKESATLAVVHKRVSNILAKYDNNTVYGSIKTSILKDPAEINLATYLNVISEKLQPLFDTKRYQDALIELASLSEHVTAFFDNVMVMTDDYQVRINRLTLLSQLHKLFLKIADISLLQ
ncbi:Glycine--tRNA ligase beta subunit [secondary endosymbiont of Trabutina mannipara]|uniref:Glycine--tRNA ligase beta subunit n=1 Tax=secondary endosymbiont of Trabutina mannipara TaxID=1835721 RepID=A0A1C3L429_9ENTR|nr:glycine--tRNA ligase subunit beta [secondary endosymbiont of Trabutina mannipara]SBT82040.1 Glycine--tRNA ligase beta subunit [secondary endosymbiont of Trabutina mannipara]